MTTALLTHPDCLRHVTPPGHPERVERLEAILAALGSADFAALRREEAPLATDEQIERAHPAAYLGALAAAAPERGMAALDADTFLGPHSLAAARRAAGAVVRAVDLVTAGEARNAFCAVRPPGHHAERATAMGFCFLDGVVIGARHALAAHGLARVAIVDFDVHHGNGTQDLVWDDARILFASSHQRPLYPGTGAPGERGAHGQVVNLPLPPGTGGDGFRAAWRGAFPAIEAHEPEMILVSAGFDAHVRDPLANLSLTEADFAWITGELCTLADRLCAGRIVSTLEGGYDLTALAASAAAHVKVLVERGR